MHVVVSMTVSESKRLIAKGIAAWDTVTRAMDEGTLAVCSGTTNGYIVEEITGEAFDKHAFVTGRTLPATYDGPKLTYTAADLVIRKGQRLDIKATEAISEMGPGDVLIKGANALNYERGQAGVLIGHPTGGTVGATIGTAVARRVRFVHPVGLEKSVSNDLVEASELINTDAEGEGPTLWVLPGDIITEIEALQILTGVDGVHVASGGVGGAEGAVWLAIFGEASQLDRAQQVLADVRGQRAFVGR